jgi:hypothetical protein
LTRAMIGEDNITNLFSLCKCPTVFSIEAHGDVLVLYLGRCDHRHGYNLVHLSDEAHNFDADHIVKLLNLGSDEYLKNPDGGHIAE